jgi:hypothetical protein
MSLKTIVRPLYRAVIDSLPAETHVQLDFFRAHKKLADLKNPRSFNEKIAWRKLFDHDARFPDLVDKIKAKTIIGGRYGADLIIPTLAVFSSAEEMNFDAPPLSQPPYVIKLNHSYQSNIFVRSRPSAKEIASIKSTLGRALREDHGARSEEWAYSQVERRIFIEPLLATAAGYLPDYKFHVFNGKASLIETVIDLQESVRGIDWKPMPFKYKGYPRPKDDIPEPDHLKEMVVLAEKLAAEFTYARVDLYDVDGQIKFGEMTFYPGAGNDVFEPAEWDYTIGSLWQQDFAHRKGK